MKTTKMTKKHIISKTEIIELIGHDLYTVFA